LIRRVPQSGIVSFRIQVQRCRIHTEAIAGRRRAVRKDVAQMGIASAAQHFRPAHKQAAIFFQRNRIIIYGRPETRPAGA